MGLRDRVVEFRRVTGKELLKNPANWRQHTSKQGSALRGLLEEVGVADALIAYHSERQGGALTLIDGHLRQDVAPDHEWPVLILDVNDAEASKLLVSMDPIAALAESDSRALDAVLREVDTGNPALMQMWNDLAAQAKLYEDAEDMEDTGVSIAPEPKDQGDPEAVQLRIGEYRALIALEEYNEWVENLKYEVGFDEGSIIEEIARRLGLTCVS